MTAGANVWGCSMGSIEIIKHFLQYIPSVLGIPCYQVQENLVQRSEFPFCVIQQISAVAQGQSDMQAGYEVSRTVLYRMQIDCYTKRIETVNATTYLEQLSLYLNARSTYFAFSKVGLYMLPNKGIGQVFWERGEDTSTAMRAMLDLNLYTIITATLPNLGYVEKIEGEVKPV